MSVERVIHLVRGPVTIVCTSVCGASGLFPHGRDFMVFPCAWAEDIAAVTCLKCIVIATREQVARDA